MSASLLELKSLTAENIARVFSLADRLSAEKPGDRDVFHQRRGLTAALVFFEPSTRTRMSFEAACHREGLGPITLDGGVGTSLEKGETPEDTVLNIAAMNPSLMIIRCGDDLDLAAMAKKIRVPILNAGWGRFGHPTQALLDAYAISKKRGQIGAQKVLIVGDVRHSRVAASHFELAKILGYEIGLCGPASFLPEGHGFKTFANLQEGLKWSTVAMALRVQLERHPGSTDLSDYHAQWGLHPSSLQALDPHALIMHPGPVNWGVEMSAEVAQDRRTIILDQVTGGVAIRQALIRLALQEVP